MSYLVTVVRSTCVQSALHSSTFFGRRNSPGGVYSTRVMRALVGESETTVCVTRGLVGYKAPLAPSCSHVRAVVFLICPPDFTSADVVSPFFHPSAEVA